MTEERPTQSADYKEKINADFQNFLEELGDSDDSALCDKLDALVAKAEEFDEIFEAFQNSSGEIQDKCIESRAEEMLEEFQSIADSFTDEELDEIRRAVADENFDDYTVT